MRISVEVNHLNAVPAAQLNTIWHVIEQDRSIEGDEIKDFAEGLLYVIDYIVCEKTSSGNPIMEECTWELDDETADRLKTRFQRAIDQIDAGLKEEPANA